MKFLAMEMAQRALRFHHASSFLSIRPSFFRQIHRTCLNCQQIATNSSTPEIPQQVGAAPLPEPPVDGQHRQYSQKIVHLVEQIAQLPLIEVTDLNEALKSEEDASVKQKTAFAVKLVQFDAAKKIALIKAIKTVVPSMNLVQSKKFVESVPQMVKEDMGKDEAEQLKASLTEVGGVCEIE